MARPEDQLQKFCVSWFRTQYKNLLIYAIPNEAKRSYALAAHMKAMGLTSGIPDLCVPVPVGKYHGMYIELKAGKGKLTQNQMLMQDKLKGFGHYVTTCYNDKQFIHEVRNYLHGVEDR